MNEHRLGGLSPDGNWVDVDTGEIIELDKGPGGILFGYELYGWFSEFANQHIYPGSKWTLSMPYKPNSSSFHLYYHRLSRRLPQVPTSFIARKGRVRLPTIKWVIWNFELFHNNPEEDSVAAALRLRKLCEDQGVKPAPTPGGMGKALIKAMSQWKKGRYFAPPWISELAREHLPGNHYALREDFRRSKDIILVDAQASHHNIVNTIPIPAPHSVHRRGARVPGTDRAWILAKDMQILRRQYGLIRAMVEVDTLTQENVHLYPKWAWKPGARLEWIWTPELRLFDRRLRMVHVQTAFTGDAIDTALWQYSDFALGEIRTDSHPIIKPVLHAAYGGLAISGDNELKRIVVGDTGKHKNLEDRKLPWVDQLANIVTVKGVKLSVLQNVVAYGVICAEQVARSLQLARQYEWEFGLKVVQVYADALLVHTKQIPFTPPGWEVKGELGEVTANMPNQILAERMSRIPGLHGGRRRAVYIKQVQDSMAKLHKSISEVD